MGEVRQKKVESLLKEKIGDIILKNELKDPRLAGLIGITDISVARDIKYAKVYISCYGDKIDYKQIIDTLNNAAGYIQALLGKRLRLRYTPKLKFFPDKSIERGFRINQKLKDLFH